jgi:hypothetical protein
MTKLLAVLFALLSSIAYAGDLTIQRFALPNHETLVMPFPDAWQCDVLPTDHQQPAVLRFRAKTGSGFEMQLAPSLPVSGKSARSAAKDLRRSVERMARVERANTVGLSPAIRFVATSDGAGYYFSATLVQPRSGHYMHMTRGAIPAGRGSIAFTLLSDTNDQALVDAALVVLGDSRVEPSPAH